MKDIRDLLIKHLHKYYSCGWNNNIIEKDTERPISLYELNCLMMDVFSTDENNVKCGIIIFMIEKTKDINSVMKYWEVNSFRFNGEYLSRNGSLTASSTLSGTNLYVNSNTNTNTNINPL